MATYRPLEGKLAIITGASRGIGEAIAHNLAAKGCNLVLNYTSAGSKSLADSLAAELATTHKIRTLAVQADVAAGGDAPAAAITAATSAADLVGAARIVALARDHFTTGAETPFQIDIIINNAGIAINDRVENIKYADFTETYRVNVLGPLRLIQAAQPYLPPAGARSGRIVNLSSVSSAAGFIGQTVYGGSKAALEAMTRVWARELAEHATVNAINPGPVYGPMYSSNTHEFLADIRGWIDRTPLMRPRPGVDSEEVVAATRDPMSGGGRPAYPGEIAGIVAMLCLPDSAWCTGQVVSANGGMIMQQ
ncbi:NAD(P)-binding domain protein [Niveomyces insectorum RCEF 264]|uniref:NAD(P)-binding domain protein n=1 Tax=Niveomyces insectorum RCEF 264 TaxID=1081102 RepID=A0A167RU91_9HYPO|nr:NAD(P)-binding domain protein [Niveomyces insectorum RCEF 264]